ncbi:hypothetical protein Tco_1252214 [Tanacetum coccineum]
MFKRRLITADQASIFMAMMSVHISSGLVLHQMTSDHNRFRSDLGIQDHNNETAQVQSWFHSKSFVSLSKQDSYITTRVGITIPPSHSNAKDNSHKVVRLGINPMIQPEPEDLPKDNPKLEIAVLRSLKNEKECIDKGCKQKNPSTPRKAKRPGSIHICQKSQKTLSHLSPEDTSTLSIDILHSEIVDIEYGGNLLQSSEYLKTKMQLI